MRVAEKEREKECDWNFLAGPSVALSGIKLFLTETTETEKLTEKQKLQKRHF